MRAVVIKIGGFAFPEQPDAAFLRELAAVLRRLADEGYRLAVVAGGGRWARLLIRAGRELGASEALCDELAIRASRLNATLLALALCLPDPLNVPADVPSLVRELAADKPVIALGGLQPGQSTDAVAVLTAELMGASLVVKATDVDGIYTADPREVPDARKLDRLTYREALELLAGKAVRAGTYELLDPLALRLAERSRIAIRVVDGRDPENIYRAVKGEPIGTLVEA